MIEIYRKINKEETLVASVPDDNATLEKTLMGADEVTLSVTVSEPLDFRVGDYAHLEGSSYMINRTPDLVKASAVEFRYDLVLESPLYNLLDKIYISDVQGLSRFSLSGTLNDFVELLLMNINRDDFDPGWTWWRILPSSAPRSCLAVITPTCSPIPVRRPIWHVSLP